MTSDTEATEKVYMPSTEQIREHWSAVRGSAFDPEAQSRKAQREEAFDRWLAGVAANPTEDTEQSDTEAPKTVVMTHTETKRIELDNDPETIKAFEAGGWAVAGVAANPTEDTGQPVQSYMHHGKRVILPTGPLAPAATSQPPGLASIPRTAEDTREAREQIADAIKTAHDDWNTRNLWRGGGPQSTYLHAADAVLALFPTAVSPVTETEQ